MLLKQPFPVRLVGTCAVGPYCPVNPAWDGLWVSLVDFGCEAGAQPLSPPFSPQSNWNEIVDSFDDMNLSESLLRGIYAYGFEKPSAIQQRAILPCIKGEIHSPLYHTCSWLDCCRCSWVAGRELRGFGLLARPNLGTGAN